MSGHYLTIPAASKFTGFAAKSLRDRRFRERHGLQAIKIGGRLRLNRAELKSWLERGREDAVPSRPYDGNGSGGGRTP